MKRCLILLVFSAAFGTAFAQETLPPALQSQADRLDAAMRSLKEYCRDVDSFTSANPPTALRAEGELWHRQQTPSASTLSSYAFVWRRAGHIVAVKMWTPEVGIGFDSVSYCFRNEGSLARASVTPRASLGRDQPALKKTVATGRTWYFDEAGRRIAIVFDRRDPAPLKSETTIYADSAARLFMRVRDLPFADLLGKPVNPFTRVAQETK